MLQTKKAIVHQRASHWQVLTSLSMMLAVPVPAQAGEIEEIVVTAQKRAQSIQDVPFSITAFSSEDIRDLNVNQPRDLAQITPGLVMNVSANAETEHIELTVNPARPCGPSVVKTLTVAATWHMPSMN